eukprot:363578-Chlamydomonas_euryale.AAC.3
MPLPRSAAGRSYGPCDQAGTRQSTARGGAILPEPQDVLNIVRVCLRITLHPGPHRRPGIRLRSDQQRSTRQAPERTHCCRSLAVPSKGHDARLLQRSGDKGCACFVALLLLTRHVRTLQQHPTFQQHPATKSVRPSALEAKDAHLLRSGGTRSARAGKKR